MTKTLLLATVLFVLSVPVYAADDAQAVLDKAQKILESDPDNLEARYNHGWASATLGKHAEAERDFKAVVARADGKMKADSLFNLGYVLFMQKNLQGALDAWRAGLRHAPDDRDMQYNYTVVRRLLKQEEQKKSENKEKDKDEKSRDKKGSDSGAQQSGNHKNEEKQSGQKNPGGQQPRPGEMTKEEAIRLLKALQEQEQKTNPQDKQIMGGVRRGKDW
ncbi:MAG TPA: tetratricopeptide repeat protein [Spirochaetota bacterium]|nr:tetratricopeptide repeat protein [Spirochaetota bacterium]